MAIYQHQDYKKFVLEKIKEYPSGGHGVFRKMSELLKIPSSTLSLVFRGERDLTAEQAIDVADFFGLDDLETEYFMTLVEKRRAGNPRLRKYVESKLARTKRTSDNLKNRINKEKVLGETEKHVFYSEWYYSAIRLLTSLPDYQSAPAIAGYLGLPLGLVQRSLNFLVSCGLVIEKDGTFKMGTGTTHIGPDDPLAFRHLQNWHMQSVHRILEYPLLDDHELCISMPCSTSKEAILAIKQTLLNAMIKVVDHIDGGKEEQLVYINIDLLDGRKSPRSASKRT